MNNRDWTWLFALWLVAMSATLGALYIGEVMGRVPCNMCWYQRICMFPLAFILGAGLWRSDRAVWAYALPLALMGAGFAAYHSLLFYRIIPEPIMPCTGGTSCSGRAMQIAGWPLPLLSFVSFAIIVIGLLKLKKGPAHG